MNTPNETYVRATVNYYGMIPFLGVSGPITRPYRMKKSIYERLLANGFKVKLVENIPVPVKEEDVIASQPEPEDVTVDEEVEAEVPTADDTDNEQTVHTEEDAEIEETVEETVSEDEIADENVEDDSEDDPAEDEEVLEDSEEDEEPAEEDTVDAEYYSEEDLEGLTKAELKEILKDRGITINKNLTVDALRKKVLNSNPEM